VYSRDRSAALLYGVFFAVLIALVAIDVGRYSAADPRAMWILYTFVVPLLYFGFFLLAPLYTKLNVSKPVPARVTWKSHEPSQAGARA
jgi:hypothetical protein